jgi:hypothetical protein
MIGWPHWFQASDEITLWLEQIVKQNCSPNKTESRRGIGRAGVLFRLCLNNLKTFHQAPFLKFPALLNSVNLGTKSLTYRHLGLSKL